ncbi:MAG: SDR family oxidoreductase [Hyphomonadaceae bacterium]|jgi:hypothetical protein|nr:SDR family oxidoreductase [Hyphomonadaceae bacterium]
MVRRLCLITGASAGIGAALARVYAERGYDLALTARRMAPMQALADELKARYGTTCLLIGEDLASNGAADRILAAVDAEGRVVDALVNNAGYGLPGAWHATTWADQHAFMTVMATVPCELAHKVLPGMRERRFGRIMNVASLAGLIPGSAGHTLYGAVKSLLIKFSQSLNLENAGSGVHVSALCPGFTYSEFHDVNGTREAVSKMPAWMWQDAASVAQAGFDGLERNQAVVLPSMASHAIATVARLLPQRLALKIVARQSASYRRME